MTNFVVKDWKDSPDVSTPISAAALKDLETRATSSGGRTITPLSNAEIALTLKGAASQSASLLEVHKSDGTVRASLGVDPTGKPRIGLGLGPTTASLPMNVWTGLEGTEVVDEGPVADAIGINFQTEAKGDFTGMGGNDPGVVWGSAWTFTLGDSGGSPAATTAVTNYVGKEIGACILDATSTAVLQGLRVWSGFLGAGATGGTITQAESLRVIAPTTTGGGANGTITNAYGLFVEEVSTGASVNLSMFVAGGTSRFAGVCDMSEGSGGIRGQAGTAFSIGPGYGGQDPFTIWYSATGAGGGEYHYLPKSGATFVINDGSNDAISLDRLGLITFPLEVAAASVPNKSLYVDSTSHKLTYKDSGGVSNALY